jgi:hypothetical protein
MAAGVATPVILPGVGGIVVAACAVGGTFMVVTMLGMQEARRVGGAAAPRLMAAMTAAFGVGQIAGPLAVSVLAAADAGFASVLILGAAALTLGAAGLRVRPGTPHDGSPGNGSGRQMRASCEIDVPD